MFNNPNTDDVADAVLGALRDILAKQSGGAVTHDDDTLLETIKDVLVKNLPGGAGSTQSSYPGDMSLPRRETATANYEDEWSEMLARHAEERHEMKLRHEREREEVRARREERREEARLERERQMEARRQEREARRRERESRGQRPR